MNGINQCVLAAISEANAGSATLIALLLLGMIYLAGVFTGRSTARLEMWHRIKKTPFYKPNHYMWARVLLGWAHDDGFDECDRLRRFLFAKLVATQLGVDTDDIKFLCVMEKAEPIYHAEMLKMEANHGSGKRSCPGQGAGGSASPN